MKNILPPRQHNKSTPRSGFTIVELLVVIVVIGILAAITIVSYSGITNKANIAVLQSNLSNASKKLMIYQATYDSYPTTLNASYCPTAPVYDTTMCLKASASNTFTYTSNGTSFNLVETNPNGTTYNVTDSTTIAIFPWYPGIAATALAGKYVYKTDLGGTTAAYYAYKTSSTSVESPQGAIGIDPNNPTRMSLVSPQTNPGVDFSAYPAQNACKAIGGRLPNMQELLAIYAGRATYGNNFQSGAYWSSTEFGSDSARDVHFYDGSLIVDDKATNNYVYARCISD